MRIGIGRRLGPVGQPRGLRSAGSTLHWLTLQFSSPALEKGFQLCWARSILSVDKWYFLFTLLYMPVWFISEARRWSSTSNPQASCPAAALPYTGTYTDLCTLQKMVVCTAYACVAARIAALLALWLHPDWHVHNRTMVVAVNWLLDVLVRIMLGIARCGVPTVSCGSMLLVDACMALMFIMYHLPFSVAVLCCGLLWVVCTLLRAAVPPAVLLSEHGTQMVVQLLLPLGALHVVGRRARLAYLAMLCNSDSTAAMLAAADAASTGTQSASAAEPSHVAAAAAAVQQHGESVQRVDGDSMGVTPASSLVYESPLLHRTVAIKVKAATAGPSSSPTLTRLAATVQSAVAGLPGMDHAALGTNLCVPGCVLFLGNVIYATHQPQHRQHQYHNSQQPILCQRIWQIDLGGGCSSIGAFDTVENVESAAADGSLQSGVGCWLGIGQAAVSCREAYVIASWGTEVQLAARCVVPAGSSCYCTQMATTNGLMVRLVLAHGSTVVFDREQLLPPCGAETAVWTLQLQLPGRDGRGSSNSTTRPDGDGGSRSSSHAQTESAAESDTHQPFGVMSLYILPAAQQHQRRSSSPNSTLGQQAPSLGPMFAPLAHISLLILPDQAADALSSWLQQHRISRQQLQPVLVDMAIVLEALNMLQTAAAVAAASAGADQGSGQHWDLAVRAAGRLLQFFDSNALASCSEIAVAVQQQVLAVSRVHKPSTGQAADALCVN